jgi:hypothetical protein
MLSLTSLFSLILVWMMSVLAFVWFTKLFTIIFAWNARDSSIKLDIKSNKCEYISYWILTSWILILSFIPWIINLFASRIFSFIETPKNLFSIQVWDIYYIPVFISIIIFALWYSSFLFYKKIAWKEEKMDVWNCWYPKLIAKSQYRAESLIQAIRRVYKWLYSETNTLSHISKVNWKSYYKKYLSSIDYSRGYFLKVHFLYEKLINFVGAISTKLKSMQSWVLQDYVSYMLLTLIITVLYILIFNS